MDVQKLVFLRIESLLASNHSGAEMKVHGLPEVCTSMATWTMLRALLRSPIRVSTNLERSLRPAVSSIYTPYSPAGSYPSCLAKP